MPTEPKVPDKADDKDQSERFIKTAQEHNADERRTLENTFKKIVRSLKGSKPS